LGRTRGAPARAAPANDRFRLALGESVTRIVVLSLFAAVIAALTVYALLGWLEIVRVW
jgi:hypothetical protein